MENSTESIEITSLYKPFDWRMNNYCGKGYIRRRMVGDGFFVTQGYFQMPQPFRTFFQTPMQATAFVFMLSGRTRIRVSPRHPYMEMREGEIYAFVDSGESIRRETLPDQIMETLVIRIGVDRMAEICSDIGVVLPDELRRGYPPIIRGNMPAVGMLLEKIRHNRLTNATECLLAQAINLVCDLFLKQEEEATNKEGRGVHDLTAYIASDVGRNFDLSELARMTLLNRTKLNRLFKEVYGCTVFEFIRRERLHRAENWLSQTDMSITDIAYAAGFCSSSHFCRCFHQIYGNPPKNFRSCIRTR